MRKNRGFTPLYIFLCLIFLISHTMAAEVSGTLGPDENQHAGFRGEVKLPGDAYLANGAACDENWECYSSHCAWDFDGSGKWCAQSGYCAHDGNVSYSNGSKTCYGANILATCSNGSWSLETCSGSCSNGACVGGATPTPTPTVTPVGGGISGGGAAGGGAGGGPGATPGISPTPTVTPSVIREIITEHTYEYTPTSQDIQNILAEAGFSTEFIERVSQQAGFLHIERTLTVEKLTNVSTGETSYQSIFTIKIVNTSADITFENITIVEYIPKEVAASASEIGSVTEFRVLKADPIIEWIIKKLAPKQTLTIEYWVNKNVDKSAFEKGKTLFQASESIVIEKTASITAYIKSEKGTPIEETFYVALLDSSGKKIAEGHSKDGKITFTGLAAGSYTLQVAESTNYYGLSKSIELQRGEAKTVDLILSAKLAPSPTETITPKPAAPNYTLLIILIILAILGYLIYYYAVKKKEKKPAKWPKPKKVKRHVIKPKAEEKVEEKVAEVPKEAGQETVVRPFAHRREEKFKEGQ